MGRWRSVLKWAGLVAVSLPLVLAAIGWVYQWRGAATDLAASPPPGQLFEVEGRQMHIHCLGHGSPTVVLLSGLNGSGLALAPVQRRVAETTRVCTYDRAGLGYSDPLERPPRVAESAQRLSKLLEQAGEDDGVVLVAASYGGIIARSFHEQYSEQSLGMVLLDSSHERQEQAAGETDPEGASPLLRAMAALQPFGVVRGLGFVEGKVSGMEELTDAERAQMRATYGRSSAVRGMVLEEDGSALEYKDAKQPPTLGDLPLVVLTQARPVELEDFEDEDEYEASLAKEELWRELQQQLVGLSTRGEWVLATQSGHNIARDQPELVLSAIARVVGKVRGPEAAGDPVAPPPG